MTGERKYLEVARKSLNFTFTDGMYIPIGQNGWFSKEGTDDFDQQPEDTTATVEALNTMFQVTNGSTVLSSPSKDRKHYKELVNIALNWFLGDNVLWQVVYDWK